MASLIRRRTSSRGVNEGNVPPKVLQARMGNCAGSCLLAPRERDQRLRKQKIDSPRHADSGVGAIFRKTDYRMFWPGPGEGRSPS